MQVGRIGPVYRTLNPVSLYYTTYKEVLFMKTAAYKQISFMSRPIVPLPNAATRRQFLHKALDSVLIVASSIGIAVMLLFLLTLI